MRCKHNCKALTVAWYPNMFRLIKWNFQMIPLKLNIQVRPIKIASFYNNIFDSVLLVGQRPNEIVSKDSQFTTLCNPKCRLYLMYTPFLQFFIYIHNFYIHSSFQKCWRSIKHHKQHFKIIQIMSVNWYISSEAWENLNLANPKANQA